MILDLDPALPTPLYLQLIEGVRRLVAIGALRPGDRLPPVRDLASQLRLNRNTVARAVQELEAQGVVRTRVGQGTFVADEAGAAGGASRETLLDAAIDRLLDEAAALAIPPGSLAASVAARLAARARDAAHPAPRRDGDTTQHEDRK